MATDLLEIIDDQLAEKIIQKCKNYSTITILNVHAEPAIGKGENFLSDMFRVKIKFSHVLNDETVTEEKSLIFKVLPTENEDRKNQLTASGMYTTETSMLMETVKDMRKILDDKYILSAKGLFCRGRDPIFLVMEDLKALGFQMADRNDGLDMKHSSLAMEGLARFHAASIKLCEKNPNLKTTYTQGMFDEVKKKSYNRSTYYFKTIIAKLAEEISTWPEIDPKYAEVIMNMEDKIYDLGIKGVKLNENEFSVITHGDYWINNMMFKYEGHEPVDHVMVDFQFSKYTSPAVDLVYFFSTSISDETSEKGIEKLVEKYYETLCSTMEQIECATKPLTYEELQKQIADRSVFHMVSTFAILPAVLLDKSRAKSTEEFLYGDKNDRETVKSLRFRKIVSERLPLYEKLGIL